ncbi:MAG: hypothetical protein ACE148_08195 [Vicinamibacterales bacterium]
MAGPIFEFLFKYPAVVFEQGDFVLTPSWPAVAVALAAGAIAAVAAAWSYLRAPAASRVPRRAFLAALRLGTIALILFLFLRPALIVRAVETERNFLAVILDDSRSMAIADSGGTPRSRFISDSFGPDGKLGRALADRFTLRFFRFSAATERLADPADLAWDGTRTHVGQALERVGQELTGLPVSGVVLVSDGADTSQAAIAESLRVHKATGVPVFTVGVGREAFERDVQIGRVEPPATVLEGSTVAVDVLVGQTGYAGQRVQMTVEDEGRLAGTQDVTLPADGEAATVRVRFTLPDAGPRLLRFRLPVLDGEQVTQNNVREAVITVEDRREKVLYIEGEPRYEMKFIRRAVAEDRNLQVVTLQRTADRKFLRLDIDSPEDLAGGFPNTREELFAYRGIILGSIEASAFTPDQLRMIADFVSVRGGGLIALGGRRSFAEGGYAGTPVGEALPVVLEGESEDSFFEEVRVSPTRFGQTHVAVQIGDTEQASIEKWRSLPPATAVNPIRRVKPGAVVLLAGAGGKEGGGEGGQVVLAYQRYGAGKALALPVQDSWLWQMHAEVPVEDQTHETLWRRLIRWLVEGVPDRVNVSVSRERLEPGERVDLTATVYDAGFVAVNDATAIARITSPSGAQSEVAMEFVLDRDGEYRAGFVAGEPGLYEVRVEAMRGRDSLGGGAAFVRSAPGDEEYFDAAMRRPLLERIARETGGRFYTPVSVASLPQDVTYLGRGMTVVEQKDLWDMPIVLLALVSLLGAEWFLRRRWGLA